MNRHPSAIKRARQNEKRRVRNAGIRTYMRTVIKRVKAAVAANDAEAAGEALKIAVPVIAKSASSGVIHGSTASRNISRLTRHVHKLQHS